MTDGTPQTNGDGFRWIFADTDGTTHVRSALWQKRSRWRVFILHEPERSNRPIGSLGIPECFDIVIRESRLLLIFDRQ